MKGKKKFYLKGFIPLATAFVIMAPSFAYAATPGYTFMVKNAFEKVLIGLGVTSPHQDTFTAYVDSKVNVDVDSFNYRTQYKEGEELKIKVTFTSEIRNFDDDIKMVIKFGDDGVERVLTKDDIIIENNEGIGYDNIIFSYALKSATYNSEGDIVDKGDNGGLIFCYFQGKVYTNEDKTDSGMVIALPSNLNMYKNTIIADTNAPKIKTDGQKIIANEKIYKYVPGEVTYNEETDETTDDRENGVVTDLKASDIKIISNSYQVTETFDGVDSYAIGTGSNIEAKNNLTYYDQYKKDNKVIMYKNNANKYYLKLSTKSNTGFVFVEVTDYCQNVDEQDDTLVALNKDKLFDDLSTTTSTIYTQLKTALESIVDTNSEEQVQINDIDTTGNQNKNTVGYIVGNLKTIFEYNGTIKDEKIETTKSGNKYIVKDNKLTQVNLYYGYKAGDKTLFYKDCQDKYYINISNSTDKVNFINISQFMKFDENGNPVNLNLTKMNSDKSFTQNNFMIDVETYKNTAGKILLGGKSVKNDESEVTTYTWTTYINGQKYEFSATNKDKLKSDYVYKNISNYFNQGDVSTEEKGETRIISLDDEKVIISEVEENIPCIYLTSMKQEVNVDRGEITGSYTAYYNSEISASEPIMYKSIDEKGKIKYFMINTSDEKVDITDYVTRDEKNNLYIDYTNLIAVNIGLDLTDGVDVVRKTNVCYEIDTEDLFETDEICIPNISDAAGNTTGVHLRYANNELNVIKKIYEETTTENAVSPVIEITTDGVTYQENEESEIIYFNKKGSKYTITAMAHYRDGAVQVGFLNVADPANTDKEPKQFNNAKYINYDESTGMSTWEYEVNEGDQGRLFIKVTDCSCDTNMYTAEVKDGDEVVTPEGNYRITEYKNYYADSIAPTVTSMSISNIYGTSIYKKTEDSEDSNDLSTVSTTDEEPGGIIWTNIPNNPEYYNLEMKLNIQDETKMNIERSSGSYTSEEGDAHFEYKDICDSSNCIPKVDEDGEYVYDEQNNLVYDKYGTYNTYEENENGFEVYREKETGKTINQDDLGNYDTDTVTFNYTTGEWENSYATALNHKIGEYIDYVVDAKALLGGVATPIVRVTDYAGNENAYKINKDENGDCIYLVLVDNEAPEYEVKEITEGTNQDTFDCIVDVTDPAIDNHYGSGIGYLYSPVVTNGKVIKSEKIEETKENNKNIIKVKYTIMPENDGYTKLYFDEGTYVDNVRNESKLTELKKVYVDTTAPEIIDIVGIPDSWAEEATISVIANDLSTIQYAFQLVKEGEEFNKETLQFSTSNKVNVTENGTLYIVVRDELGNEVTKEIQITQLDNSLSSSKTPVIKTATIKDYYTIPTGADKAKFDLELEADSDNACNFYYALSSTKVSDCTTLTFTKASGLNKIKQTIELTEGKWYVYFYAVDIETQKNSGYYVYNTPIEIGKSTITFLPSSTQSTKNGISVAINYGRGLTENRYGGFENSREANITSVLVTENGTVYAEATDSAGNKVYATYEVKNINTSNVGNAEENIADVLFNTETDDSVISKVVQDENEGTNNFIILKKSMTVSDLVESGDIISTGTIKIMNTDSTTELNNTAVISTGKVLKLSDLEDEYTIVVQGDANGDGEINMLDIIKVNKARLNKTSLSEAEKISADINNNDKIDMLDIVRINKIRLKK